METIAVSELRNNLMSVLKQIESGTSITITTRGREIARLVPPENSSDKAKKALKKLSKTAIIRDIISPIDEEWEAMQ